MANVINYLEQLQKLTNTNLEILKALNDSFYTKRNHIIAQVDDTSYVIPSFLSLENKINMLQENFENLVHSPETNEAYFNFDGNTRAIEVRKYSHMPDGITLPEVSNFKFEQNDIFKDFMTPVPYINLELPELPNDIVEVNVKKIIPKSEALKSVFRTKLSYTDTYINETGETVTETKYKKSINSLYGDINKTLLNYVEDVDYVNYDTIYKLPLRQNLGNATYVIESVVSDIIDNDLTEFITLKLRTNMKDPIYTNKLTYRSFNDTIERPLQIGDELINYDGTGKVQITEVRTSTNTIVVKVVNGEYLNFIGTDSYDSDNDSDIHNMSKLRFLAPDNYTKDKYIKVPLEEDQYVFIAAAPVNSRMNTQASWGNGLIINAHSLMDLNETESFKSYYDANVKNIGDVLFEMTSMVTSPVTEISEPDFKTITSIKPVINTDLISVMHINKHLNNSSTIQNIRNAYAQKQNANNKLQELQERIDEVNKQIMEVSFDDATGMRSVYTTQLNALNAEKNTLITTITKAIDNISMNVNSAEIPIENAKYRIRGFYVPNNLGTINNEDLADHVIGIKVQYRYKNVSLETGSAVSIANPDGSSYIFSDWNNMSSFDKKKIAHCKDGVYSYGYEASNEAMNEPSYNQIDIPITQGETVDIRIKLLYDFGQPYITVTSGWSDIVNIEFPDEFTKDVPILTIIEENNNDIETNRFSNILKTEGVNDHIQDMITDQDITYYHKPDNIASGFYTSERRVIPLKDKLQSMSNEIAELKSEILASQGALSVSLSIADNIIPLHADQDNNFTLEPYNSFTSYTEETVSGSYIYDENEVVSTSINILLTNNSNVAIKLYSCMPGSRSAYMHKLASDNKSNYCFSDGSGVFIKNKNGEIFAQSPNQFITFRINDAWDGTPYYSDSAKLSTQNMQNSKGISTFPAKNSTDSSNPAMIIYPYINERYALCLDSDAVKSYVILNPGEERVVPLYCQYRIPLPNSTIKKTISFDIRTSLFANPINYTFSVTGKNSATLDDKISIVNNKKLAQRIYKVYDNFSSRLSGITGIRYNSTLK